MVIYTHTYSYIIYIFIHTSCFVIFRSRPSPTPCAPPTAGSSSKPHLYLNVYFYSCITWNCLNAFRIHLTWLVPFFFSFRNRPSPTPCAPPTAGSSSRTHLYLNLCFYSCMPFNCLTACRLLTSHDLPLVLSFSEVYRG